MIRIKNRSGGLDARILRDPRLSQSQIETIRKAAKADTLASIEGLDQKMRPIIYTRQLDSHGRPEGEVTRYALQRNGAPVKPFGLYENWS